MSYFIDDYEYYMRDFRSMLGCPQCEAQKRKDAGVRGGFFAACYDVLLVAHECGKAAGETTPTKETT